MTHEKVLGENY